MGKMEHVELSPEIHRMVKDEDSGNLLKFHEKERIELEEKLRNLQAFMKKIDSSFLKESLASLESRLALLRNKTNYKDV